ncbi:hypothetical protein ALC62_08425 [Cyphomyrmex costatus]|uniref:Uncharacterized protein n=1 Tax=Cyphomyrmex costatus TaxID=456900 RepID=A0A195CJW9_9HYME|nr:hypothetical protein ALC62_08425 [Cyphomyrmex costatus]
MHTASSYLPVHVVRPALKLFDGHSPQTLARHFRLSATVFLSNFLAREKGIMLFICWPLKYNRRAPLKLRNNVSLSQINSTKLSNLLTFCADKKRCFYV